MQALDGIGAGIFGVMWVLIVADLTRGTGRYGVTLGLINAAHMVGFFLSQTTAGMVVDHFDSYAAGFTWLTVIAASALLLFAVAMPETREASLYDAADRAGPASRHRVLSPAIRHAKMGRSCPPPSPAKAMARQEKRTLGEVFSRLLRQALTQPAPAGIAEPAARYGFRPLSARGKLVTNEAIDRLREDEGI